MDIDTEIKRLLKDRCECVPCPSCNGTGIVGWQFGTGPIHSSRIDDLEDPIECEECGHAEETCYRCQELTRLQQEKDDDLQRDPKGGGEG